MTSLLSVGQWSIFVSLFGAIPSEDLLLLSSKLHPRHFRDFKKIQNYIFKKYVKQILFVRLSVSYFLIFEIKN